MSDPRTPVVLMAEQCIERQQLLVNLARTAHDALQAAERPAGLHLLLQVLDTHLGDLEQLQEAIAFLPVAA